MNKINTVDKILYYLIFKVYMKKRLSNIFQEFVERIPRMM